MTRLFQILFFVLTTILSNNGVQATITLSTTGKQLHSRAADFGLNFEYDLQYVALLQYVPDDMHLCHGVTEIHPDEEEDDNHREKVIRVPSSDGSVVGNNSTDNGGGNHPNNSTANDGNKNNNKKKQAEDNMIHITPSHGVPVALLAKRGQCTYETKAKVASKFTSPRGVVRFLIVYDDKMEDGEHLITMMPKDGHDGNLYNELGLVFVSYESGMGELFHQFCPIVGGATCYLLLLLNGTHFIHLH